MSTRRQTAPAPPTPEQLADAFIAGNAIEVVLKAGHLGRVAASIENVTVLTNVIQIFQARLDALRQSPYAVILSAAAPQPQKPKRESYEFSEDQMQAISMALNSLKIDKKRGGSFIGHLSGNFVKSQGVLSKGIVESAAKSAHIKFRMDSQKDAFYAILASIFSKSHTEGLQADSQASSQADSQADSMAPSEDIPQQDVHNDANEPAPDEA